MIFRQITHEEYLELARYMSVASSTSSRPTTKPIRSPGSEPDLQILDVREESEWAAGHIPDSTLMPWHDITGLPDDLDPERPIAVMCASGQRAAVAASLVQRHGAEKVIHVVDGGVPKWGRLGHRLERSSRTSA